LVVRDDGFSSASSIGNLADASVQPFLVARYEGTLANPPKPVTLRPRITDLRPSASVEDDDVSKPLAVAAGPNSQLPALDGCATLTIGFEQ
jgi:hypothetical protein